MASLELDPGFSRALRLLHSKNKESEEQLMNMLDDAIKQRHGISKILPILLFKNEAISMGDISKAAISNLSRRKDELRKESEKKTRDKMDESTKAFSKRNASPAPTQQDDNDDGLALEILEEDLTSVVCRGMDVVARNRLVECIECHSLYHQECHQPPVAEADMNDPRSAWYCSNCTKTVTKVGAPKQVTTSGTRSSIITISRPMYSILKPRNSVTNSIRVQQGGAKQVITSGKPSSFTTAGGRPMYSILKPRNSVTNSISVQQGATKQVTTSGKPSSFTTAGGRPMYSILKPRNSVTNSISVQQGATKQVTTSGKPSSFTTAGGRPMYSILKPRNSVTNSISVQQGATKQVTTSGKPSSFTTAGGRPMYSILKPRNSVTNSISVQQGATKQVTTSGKPSSFTTAGGRPMYSILKPRNSVTNSISVQQGAAKQVTTSGTPSSLTTVGGRPMYSILAPKNRNISPTFTKTFGGFPQPILKTKSTVVSAGQKCVMPNINIISADKRHQIMNKKAAKMQEKRTHSK